MALPPPLLSSASAGSKNGDLGLDSFLPAEALTQQLDWEAGKAGRSGALWCLYENNGSCAPGGGAVGRTRVDGIFATGNGVSLSMPFRKIEVEAVETSLKSGLDDILFVACSLWFMFIILNGTQCNKHGLR